MGTRHHDALRLALLFLVMFAGCRSSSTQSPILEPPRPHAPSSAPTATPEPSNPLPAPSVTPLPSQSPAPVSAPTPSLTCGYSYQATHFFKPAWSPDSTRIAFLSFDESVLSHGPPSCGNIFSTGTYWLHVMGREGENALRLKHVRYNYSAFSWAPDGTKLAVIDQDRNLALVYTRPLQPAGADPQGVPEHTTSLSWSPDGTSVAGLAKTGLSEYLVYLVGHQGIHLGKPVTWFHLENLPQRYDFPWLTDSQAEFVPDNRFAWAPAGQSIFFSAGPERLPDGDWQTGIYAYNIEKKTRQEIMSWRTREHTSVGDLAFSPKGDKLAFSLNVRNSEGYGEVRFAELYTINPEGQEKKLVSRHAGQAITRFSWAPDSNRIALAVSYRKVAPIFAQAIYTVDTENLALQRLLADSESRTALVNDYPAWSTSGDLIAFVSNRDTDFAAVKTKFGLTDIYTMKPDGSGIKRLTQARYKENL